MNEYERLIARMKILYHSLTTLHRNLVRDEAWFANHKQIGKCALSYLPFNLSTCRSSRSQAFGGS